MSIMHMYDVAMTSNESTPAKLTVPTRDPLEKRKTELLLDEKRKLLQEKMLARIDLISTGVWSKEKKSVLLIKMKGSYWKKFGHCLDKSVYIYPEEALFLLEMGFLRILYNEIPMSIQQAYSTMIGDLSINLRDYRVFSLLSHNEYIVNRLKINSEVKITRFQIEATDIIEKELISRKSRSKKFKSSYLKKYKSKSDDIKSSESSRKDTTKSNTDTEMKAPLPKLSASDLKIESETSSEIDPNETDISDPKQVTKRRKLFTYRHLPLKKFKPLNTEDKQVDIFAVLSQTFDKEEVTVPKIESRFIPNSIVLENNVYRVNVKNITTSNVDRNVRIYNQRFKSDNGIQRNLNMLEMIATHFPQHVQLLPKFYAVQDSLQVTGIMKTIPKSSDETLPACMDVEGPGWPTPNDFGAPSIAKSAKNAGNITEKARLFRLFIISEGGGYSSWRQLKMAFEECLSDDETENEPIEIDSTADVTEDLGDLCITHDYEERGFKMDRMMFDVYQSGDRNYKKSKNVAPLFKLFTKSLYEDLESAPLLNGIPVLQAIVEESATMCLDTNGCNIFPSNYGAYGSDDE